MKTILFLSILAALFIQSSSPQNMRVTCKVTETSGGPLIKVKGKVTETSGEPLVGANIKVVGTTIGTITDMQGAYEIEVSSDGKLEFSFVGFVTKVIDVNDQCLIDVVMESEVKQMDEIVVIGYGTQKKANVTGSITSVSSESIVPTGNPLSKNLKTWKRSGGSENAVRLSIGDDEDDEDDCIPLVGTHMEVTVDGFRARVVLNYYFYSEERRAEGTFKIRMPAGASPCYFAFGSTVYLNKDKENQTLSFKDYYEEDSIYLNNNRILETKSNRWKQPKEAKVVPVSEAVYAYNETVRGRIDPMLAEWAGADIFNCRLFPIEQNQMHRVVIAYDVNLTDIGNDKVFNLSIPKTKSTTIVDIDIAKLDGVETVISRKKGLKDDKNRIKLHVENPDKEEISIRYKNPNSIALIDKQDSYFASSLVVDLPKISNENFSSNAVFMLDISASSNPDKFNVWLKLLKAILENNQDRIKQFNVLFFNIETFWFKNTYVENNAQNRDSLFAFCDKLSLEGATDIAAAVSEACSPEWERNLSNKNIFLLSDGSATWGEENLYSISKSTNDNSRIFVYNTGISGTDMNMLEHLARESGGVLFSVTGEDEIAQASTAFKFEAWKISSLKLEGCSDLLIEGRPKFLYSGQKIIVAGRGVPIKDAKLELKLGINKQKESLFYSLDKKLISGLAKRVYGQIAVNQLESFDFFTEKKSIAYAKYFQVPGKTCSMLMLENQADYDRYKIDLSADSSVVNEIKVNTEIEKTLTQIVDSKGTEKDKFFNQLNCLSKAPNAKFTLSDSLKKLIEKIPNEKFSIIPSKLQCKRRFKIELPGNVIEELKKEDLKYYIIEYESDTIEKKYSNQDALKLLSTIVERNPGNGNLIRDVAFSAMRLGLSQHAYYLFKRVMEKVPNEPHAYLALAQILSDIGNNDLALLYYEIAYITDWDGRFGDMKNIVGLDYLRFLRSIKNSKAPLFSKEFANQKLRYLEDLYDQKSNQFNLDKINMMLSITWNTNNSDVDLHVIEPSGEECFYSHRNTKNGGCLTYDVTQGYGPEMYISPTSLKGTYKTFVHYFSDVVNRASTRSQVYVVIYENWGKKNEKVTRKVVSLKDKNESQEIANINIDEID